MSDLVFRTADLNPRRSYDIVYQPDAPAMAALATQLELTALRKFRLEGVLKARGKQDWQFTGKLGATVVQPCVVTLEPVTTRLDERVARVFIAEWDAPDESEVEMPQDDSTEPLGAEIDLISLASEALALAVPEYPRADGAELGEMVYTKPGETAMRDEDAKPFAGLAALKGKLEGKN